MPVKAIAKIMIETGIYTGFTVSNDHFLYLHSVKHLSLNKKSCPKWDSFYQENQKT